ncbi:hypothetical protein MLD38_010473 [Melastoma candidum]|uniref:Uncharacterized protein n=1 Tax=Melastoma candidum TaxID=119954 RepID=A0ACB9R026_9MYRT|nr:hypothetical protein MLD38_010473 [Melastoma candidum]
MLFLPPFLVSLSWVLLGTRFLFRFYCRGQEALEAHDGASKRKYTIGLGQDCMGFCTEVEDVISMSLTVVSSFLEKYGIDPKQIWPSGCWQ